MRATEQCLPREGLAPGGGPAAYPVAMRAVFACSILTAIAACGGSSTPSTTTVTSEPAVVGPPAVAWKDLSREQRGKYMEAVVTPKLKALFVAYDGEAFAEFGCKTCHGDGADAKTFKMPSPNLFVLPGTPEGFGELGKEKPEYMKFMATQVKPTMAKLLGIEEYDPADPKPGTFGCMACHTAETAGS